MSNNQDLHDERISRLYKLGDQLEPPEQLDREIKRAAHAAVPTKKRSYVWPSLATAAVLVLSISLVLQVLQQKPLEEAIMEPSTTNGGDVKPEVMLKESAGDIMYRRDKEAQKLQINRAIKPKALPAPTRPEATHYDAAPAVTGELKSSQMSTLECNGFKLPETDSGDEWIKQYQKAIEMGKPDIAKCLEQAYQSRFNRAMPAISK